MTVNRASARYEGFGKEGKGSITTKSGVLDKQPYGFGTRFEGLPGTNPEELIAAAHAACFTMALSFGLARAGYAGDTLDMAGVSLSEAPAAEPLVGAGELRADRVVARRRSGPARAARS